MREGFSTAIEEKAEFGTYKGGLTLLFDDACPGVEIQTYDNERHIKSEFDNVVNINYPCPVDILSGDHHIINTLTRPIKKLLYIDNGDKPREFNMYVPLLNSGDMIGCHDWDINKTELCPHNIYLADIKNVLPNLTPHRFGEFSDKEFSTRFWIVK